jgi:hypothetical protein
MSRALTLMPVCHAVPMRRVAADARAAALAVHVALVAVLYRLYHTPSCMMYLAHTASRPDTGHQPVRSKLLKVWNGHGQVAEFSSVHRVPCVP